MTFTDKEKLEYAEIVLKILSEHLSSALRDVTQQKLEYAEIALKILSEHLSSALRDVTKNRDQLQDLLIHAEHIISNMDDIEYCEIKDWLRTAHPLLKR